MPRQTILVDIISSVFYSLIYVVYIALSDIYIYFPPLVGILFIIFYKNVNKKNIIKILAVIFCILFYELDKLLVIGVMPFVFLITAYFIIIKLEEVVSANALLISLYVIILYAMYVFFLLLLRVMFDVGLPSFNNIFIFFILADIFLSLIYQYIWKKDAKVRYKI